ncbi:MAG: hypothetical protein M0P74_15490 [Syntrophales bacterium]|jgi:hypothetical protein|nr:hypothetical protein [Syntrophales bacterium]
MKTCLKSLVILVFFLIFTGCASLLPSSKTTIDSPWKDFNSAKLEYEKITPEITTVDDLKKMNFNPYEIPNIRIMNVTEIIGVFLPNPSIKIEDLDPGIQKCIEKRQRCTAYRFEPGVLNKKRVGNFWADIFTFKRHTIDTGWEFRGLITIVDDVVTYRDPAGGRPLVKTEEIVNKPLGPLQEVGGVIITEVPKLW